MLALSDRAVAGNRAREEKWLAAMSAKQQVADAATTNADANIMQSRAALRNANINQFAAQETSRHNMANEGLEGQKIKQDSKKNDQAFELGKEKNATDRMHAVSTAELQGKQGLLAEASAGEAKAKGALETSKQNLRDQYMNPNTPESTRTRIQGLYEAESGNKGRSPLHVIPGQKITTQGKGGAPVESYTNPLIVDDRTATSVEVKPAQPSGPVAPPLTSSQFSAMQARLDSMPAGPDKDKAQAEYDELKKTRGGN